MAGEPVLQDFIGGVVGQRSAHAQQELARADQALSASMSELISPRNPDNHVIMDTPLGAKNEKKPEVRQSMLLRSPSVVDLSSTTHVVIGFNGDTGKLETHYSDGQNQWRKLSLVPEAEGVHSGHHTRIRLGRSPKTDGQKDSGEHLLVIPGDDKVSRDHAVITVVRQTDTITHKPVDHYQVTDASTNGTVVRSGGGRTQQAFDSLSRLYAARDQAEKLA